MEMLAGEMGTQVAMSAALRLLPELFVPIKPGHLGKPAGGLWTSTLVNGSTAWADWCRAESFGNPDAQRWHVVIPDPTARVLVVDSLAGYVDLVERFPYAPFAFDPTARSLDFLAILAAGYSAVHLTERGNAECHHPSPHPPGIDWLCLNSWDCESTVWLAWVFTGWSVLDRHVVVHAHPRSA